jgi:hypothetical protein
LESFPWWDSPTKWAATAYKGAWFIKKPDTDGSFLVDTEHDVYEVFPPLSYSINDSWYKDDWWLEVGQPVQIESLGKWQFLYGLRGLHLPLTQSSVPQEIWVLLQGGWSTSVDAPKRRFWKPKIKPVENRTEPEDFREYLAQTTGLTEHDLWVFSCLLDSFNLGLAFVPSNGQIKTYEMSELLAATQSPEIVATSYHPSINLRNVGVGMTSFSFGVSGSGGSNPIDDSWYRDTLKSINTPINSPDELLRSLTLATRWTSERWHKGFVTKPLEDVRNYLVSQPAQEHFRALSAAGYAVALIPLGGRTIWMP